VISAFTLSSCQKQDLAIQISCLGGGGGCDLNCERNFLCMIAIAIAALFQIRLKGNFVLKKKNFSHFNR
jgi:hypothetical protein